MGIGLIANNRDVCLQRRANGAEKREEKALMRGEENYRPNYVASRYNWIIIFFSFPMDDV